MPNMQFCEFSQQWVSIGEAMVNRHAELKAAVAQADRLGVLLYEKGLHEEWRLLLDVTRPMSAELRAIGGGRAPRWRKA